MYFALSQPTRVKAIMKIKTIPINPSTTARIPTINLISK
jgi:hypothetical protein